MKSLVLIIVLLLLVPSLSATPEKFHDQAAHLRIPELDPQIGDARFRFEYKAAKRGEAEAQNQIGVFFYNGSGGVEADWRQSKQWFILAAQKGHVLGCSNLADLYNHKGQQFAKAAYWYRLPVARENIQAMNHFSWLLATCPDARIRNGKEAVRVAQRLVQLRSNNPMYIDTLAAAYAEAGYYKKAVSLQKQALALHNPALFSDLEPRNQYLHRLQLYQAGRPFREDN